MPPAHIFTESDVRAGALGGTLLAFPDMTDRHVMLIIPGSGPTDQHGNSPLGIRASTYRLLAHELAVQGIASVRIDKRGMYASAAAIPDPNAVTIADYVSDVQIWVTKIQEMTGTDRIWLLGHSEGGLVALATAITETVARGVILVATPGRPLGEILRLQLRSNAANEPILGEAFATIDALEAGHRVDDATLHPALNSLFRADIQEFLIDLLSYDPVKLLSKISKPALIVQGTKDLQIGIEDAHQLAGARPGIKLVLLPEVNHILKTVSRDDSASNLATYGDPDLPLASGIGQAIAAFVANSDYQTP